jgi:hypothetical protein
VTPLIAFAISPLIFHEKNQTLHPSLACWNAKVYSLGQQKSNEKLAARVAFKGASPACTF